LQKHVDKSNKEVKRGREDLGDVRHKNWDSITEAILTYSFILKNDEFELITTGGKDVVVVNKELENKSDIAKLVVIKFLNSKTKLELRQLGVKDRTRLVMDENKVITKQCLIEKSKKLLKRVKKGVAQFKALFNNAIMQGNCDLFIANQTISVL